MRAVVIKKLFAAALVLGALAGALGVTAGPAEAIYCQPDRHGNWPCE